MKLYSYIIAHDSGFSPNPFWGFCTLANCKPAIRRTAEIGDWIVGLSPKAMGNRIVYAMQVDEILSYAEYFQDKRFAAKIPDYTRGKVVYKCGDNIYEPLANGGFRQLRSGHSLGEEENPETKAHDLGGVYVLVARTFHYFGSKSIDLPDDLLMLKVGRAHKCRFSWEVIAKFQAFIASFPEGIQGSPTKWPIDDDCSL